MQLGRYKWQITHNQPGRAQEMKSIQWKRGIAYKITCYFTFYNFHLDGYHNLLVKLHGHLGQIPYYALDVCWKVRTVSWQDTVIDEVQGLLLREGHVEHWEQGDESRIHIITSSSRLTHGSHPSQVLHALPVQVLATVITTWKWVLQLILVWYFCFKYLLDEKSEGQGF